MYLNIISPCYNFSSGELLKNITNKNEKNRYKLLDKD